MRHIAIIGAGQAGLILAHSLLREGYTVDIYSDRTADQWLNESRPTGTAYLHGETISHERALGIDRWYDVMFKGHGALVHIADPAGGAPLVVTGKTELPGAAVDQRLKFHHWMNEFEKRGGRTFIESVTPERLDDISAGVDLTIIAAGKAALSNIIPRDDARSYFSKPPRRLAMAVVRNITDGWQDAIGFAPVKFNFIPGAGEFFWVPYYHKTAGKTWSGILEAIPGGPMDIFGNCKSGEEVVEGLRHIVNTFAPWDIDICKNMEYVSEDPYGWLTGQFAPTVRTGFGTLPSGRLVMPVGDTAITFDPIGGQGGNCATRNALFTARKIIERKDQPFDAAWMAAINDEFWNTDAKFAYQFNNMMLEPPTPATMILMQTAAQNRRFADEVWVRNMVEPKRFYPWILDAEATNQKVREFLA
jgi:hypothetical protein